MEKVDLMEPNPTFPSFFSQRLRLLPKGREQAGIRIRDTGGLWGVIPGENEGGGSIIHFHLQNWWIAVQVYEAERREKESKDRARLMFAIEALKVKYKKEEKKKEEKKRKKKKTITLLVEDFS